MGDRDIKENMDILDDLDVDYAANDQQLALDQVT